MDGDRDMLFQALCLDNTVPNPRVARDILNKMLKAQEKFLPQFL
jgi:alpha-galactosidase/6-phospho-beta-glucosidase family protein